jgi:hypothetical protein
MKRLLRPQVDSEANGKTVAMVRMPTGLPDRDVEANRNEQSKRKSQAVRAVSLA